MTITTNEDPKGYGVMEFVGDYPVENEELWNTTYDSFLIALTEAVRIYNAESKYNADPLYRTFVYDVKEESEGNIEAVVYKGRVYTGVEAYEIETKLGREEKDIKAERRYYLKDIYSALIKAKAPEPVITDVLTSLRKKESWYRW
jgi:hypothetical protein